MPQWERECFAVLRKGCNWLLAGGWASSAFESSDVSEGRSARSWLLFDEVALLERCDRFKFLPHL
ncbi:MAG: hypothetical protein ACM37W_21280 [Actinomycetota bacterium]